MAITHHQHTSYCMTRVGANIMFSPSSDTMSAHLPPNVARQPLTLSHTAMFDKHRRNLNLYIKTLGSITYSQDHSH